MMAHQIVADTGSFRDSTNKVFVADGRILRAFDAEAASLNAALLQADFTERLVSEGLLIASDVLPRQDALARRLLEQGWSRIVEHPKIPFISYPYEWSFSMLKDAALLHLRILEDALEAGWTLKDGTAYNIQWRGARPVFIDIGSFEEWREGTPWIGYRQFCSHFLIPLMLKAHLGIDPAPLLRSNLEGISPAVASKYFRGMKKLSSGVLSHVVLPASVEASIARRERDNAPVQQRAAARQSKAMVIGLVQSLRRQIRRLQSGIRHTDWSHYAGKNTYQESDHDQKVDFVHRAVARRQRSLTWDLGCNTGTFSKVAAEHSDYVVSVDGDGDSIEQLYLAERAGKSEKILPLVMDLANISPGQGWNGRERLPFDGRSKPDIILCLALIHHIRVSANIPIEMFLGWLRALDAEVVIEFVDRHDEMFQKLIARKTITYADYSLDQFERLVAEQFKIVSRENLKGGRRQIFHLSPA